MAEKSSSLGSNSLGSTVLEDGEALPKLFVFDLDYTLWPFWIDTHVTPPITAKKGGECSVDRNGDELRFYKDVPFILNRLSSIPEASRPRIATASRTHAPELARELLTQLTIPEWRPNQCKQGGKDPTARALDIFDHHQIYPGNKKAHFERLRQLTGLEYHDMLFFDDEPRNRNVEEYGVTMCLVRSGVCWKDFEIGVREWRRRRKASL